MGGAYQRVCLRNLISVGCGDRSWSRRHGRHVSVEGAACREAADKYLALTGADEYCVRRIGSDRGNDAGACGSIHRLRIRADKSAGALSLCRPAQHDPRTAGRCGDGGLSRTDRALHHRGRQRRREGLVVSKRTILQAPRDALRPERLQVSCDVSGSHAGLEIAVGIGECHPDEQDRAGSAEAILRCILPALMWMIKRLHDGLNIPYESLLSEVTSLGHS